MALRESLERQGSWLFRWRSYLPFVFIPVLALSLPHAGALERAYGTRVDELWKLLCLCFALSGLCVRCLVAGFVPRGTSGRNTKSQVAETLNTSGIYSLTRNPLYLGNFIMALGVVLSLEVWWLVLIVVAGNWF